MCKSLFHSHCSRNVSNCKKFLAYVTLWLHFNNAVSNWFHVHAMLHIWFSTGTSSELWDKWVYIWIISITSLYSSKIPKSIKQNAQISICLHTSYHWEYLLTTLCLINTLDVQIFTLNTAAFKLILFSNK